jgi:hypothetical protein
MVLITVGRLYRLEPCPLPDRHGAGRRDQRKCRRWGANSAPAVPNDIAVDTPRSPATFGRWVDVDPHTENDCLLWVLPGFAHGFLMLSDDSRLPLQDERPDRGAASEGKDVCVRGPVKASVAPPATKCLGQAHSRETTSGNTDNGR